MIRICDDADNSFGVNRCGRVYDDEFCSTACPHDMLGASGGYCREHDLFACPLEHVLPKRLEVVADESREG